MWKKPTTTKQPDSEAAAQGYALRLLQLAWRSEAELVEKLRAKGFVESVCDATLAYLNGLGYVDDMRLARGIARQYAESKSHGVLHLKVKLLAKKIPSDIITEVSDQVFGPEQELAAARRAVHKLGYADRLSELSYEEKQKLMAKLHARGFRPAAIRAVILEDK